MPYRKDLAYERSGTEIPFFYTDAKDMGEALKQASFSLNDACSFWTIAKANGVETIVSNEEAKRPPNQTTGAMVKAGYFVFGAITGITGLLLLLLSLGVI